MTRTLTTLTTLILLSLAGIAGIAQAQTIPTRSTPCDAATPWNAWCLQWTHEGKDTLGMTITPVFRVEQRVGTTGAWTQVASGLTAKMYYAKDLAAGTYYFRVFASHQTCPTGITCGESAPGVSGATGVSAPSIPVAPVIVVALTVNPDGSKTSRIVYTVTPRVGEVVFVAPESLRKLFAAK